MTATATPKIPTVTTEESPGGAIVTPGVIAEVIVGDKERKGVGVGVGQPGHKVGVGVMTRGLVVGVGVGVRFCAIMTGVGVGEVESALVDLGVGVRGPPMPGVGEGVGVLVGVSLGVGVRVGICGSAKVGVAEGVAD